ncbi:MAG: helix-turn-helix transcriptional regulator [Bacteroidota bacterium]
MIAYYANLIYAKYKFLSHIDDRYLELSDRTIDRILEDKKLIKDYHSTFMRLTDREREVIPLIVYGYTSAQIAEQLFIARSTVETHRKNINRKLKIKYSYQLVRLAQAFDLV